MKRALICSGITALLIALFWGIILLHGALGRLPFEGKGTVADPYQISSAADLRKLSEIVAKGTDCSNLHFVQTRDIHLDFDEFVPIGRVETNTIFYGNYDGQGHVITGIWVSEGENNALFGLIGGKIANLGVEDSYFEGTNVAGIVSHSIGNNAELINCYSKARMRGDRMGGIADNFSGIIRDCWSDCLFEGTGVEGGIVSYSALQVIECGTTSHWLVQDTFTGVIAGSIYSLESIPENPLQKMYVFEEQSSSDFEVIFGLAHSEKPVVSVMCGAVYLVMLVGMLWGAWKLHD